MDVSSRTQLVFQLFATFHTGWLSADTLCEGSFSIKNKGTPETGLGSLSFSQILSRDTPESCPAQERLVTWARYQVSARIPPEGPLWASSVCEGPKHACVQEDPPRYLAGLHALPRGGEGALPSFLLPFSSWGVKPCRHHRPYDREADLLVKRQGVPGGPLGDPGAQQLEGLEKGDVPVVASPPGEQGCPPTQGARR